MKLVSVAEMIAIEKQADANGLSYQQMMENAGRGVAEEVRRAFSAPDAGGPLPEALALVGKGNNGGDALVALAALAEAGWKVNAYLAGRPEDALTQRLREAGGTLASMDEDKDWETLIAWMAGADVLLDGLLGTGFRLPLRPSLAPLLRQTVQLLRTLDAPPWVVAIDCPSGLDCDSGQAADVCIPADLTLTMAAVKQGLLRFPAQRYVGELRVIDIGIPPDLPAWVAVQREVVDETMTLAALPTRPADAHKGTFGTALVVAGSLNYTGAAWLAGQAAYRIGAGLVNMAVPAPLHTALAASFPEAIWVLLPHELGVVAEDAAEVLLPHLRSASAMLLGPGFGREKTSQRFVAAVLMAEEKPQPVAGIGFLQNEQRMAQPPADWQLPPLVVDADGLKLLAAIENWWEKLPASTVLTPHPGEMAVLTGLPKEEIQAAREDVAARYAARWGQVVVLKGAFTVIAAPDGRLAVVPVASAALARAGTGDVLAGMIVGLLAQGVTPWEAACAAAWLHAHAGLYAAEIQGQTASVLASDVLAALPEVLADLL